MKKRILIPLITALCALPVAAQVQTLQIPFDPPPGQIATLGAQIAAAQEASRAAALQWAAQRGLPGQGLGWVLKGLANGEPQYVSSENANAAAAVGADVLAIAPGLDGSGVWMGYWEVGRPLTPHWELGRLFWQQPGSPFALNNHANHVAGTLVGTGQDPLARGMAPGATLLGWDVINDLAEITAAASVTTGRRITLSNHSYLIGAGWHNYPQNAGVRGPSGNFGWHWFGSGFLDGRCHTFGQYGTEAQYMDSLCSLVPGYLPFWAAGNERDDGPPAAGAPFRVMRDGNWTGLNYGSALHPAGDGAAGGGFGWDTLGTEGCAKNMITVGAWDPATRAMAPFSSYGPTDDGRLKPDLVAPGVRLFSAFAGGVDAYGRMSGTSMATPTAAGGAALLQQFAVQRFGTQLRADMLKGLLLHTADDVLMKGPDYLSGFGLMNLPKARDLMQRQADFPRAQVLVQDVLEQGATRMFRITVPAGAPELRATLCWIDPPGTAQETLDSNVHALINDLDIRIRGPRGDGVLEGAALPFAPDPGNPQQTCPRGRNLRDNVEQVHVENPAPGDYVVTVSHTGPLQSPFGGASQAFALVMSGQKTANGLDFWPDAPRIVRLTQRPSEPPVFADVEITNRGSSTATPVILANAVADGISAVFVKTDPVLHPGAGNTIRVSVTQTGAQYPPGVYQRRVRVQEPGSTFMHEIPVILEIPAATPSLTQQFPGAHDGECDLAYSQLVIERPVDWQGKPKPYEARWRRLAAHERRLPHAPLAEARVTFEPDEKTVEMPLAHGAGVRLFDGTYQSVHVSPNGFVCFGQSDESFVQSIASHFGLPRISAFFKNLDPAAGGMVTCEERRVGVCTEVIITWAGVPSQGLPPGSQDSHTFQLQITDSAIRITWLELGSNTGIVGLSEGGGIPASFAESNVSALPHAPSGYLSEPFSAEADIARAQLMFRPAGIPGDEGYEAFFRPGVHALPSPVAGGTVLPLDEPGWPDNTSTVRPLQDLVIFGTVCDRLVVERDGGISFYSGVRAIAGFSAFRVGFHQATGGKVISREFPDRLVLTWEEVMAEPDEFLNMQVELFYDGRIRVTWLTLPAGGGVCVFVNRQVDAVPFFGADISDYPPPPLPEVNVFTLNGHMAEGDAAQRARLRVTRTGFTDDALFTGLSALPASTASAGDYTGLPAPVIIPAGASETDIFLDAVPDNSPEGPESLTLRLITMGTVVNGPQNEVRLTILDKPVDAWLHQHGMARTHLVLDADKDGRSNFEEYATGSDPLVPGAAGAPECSLTFDGGKVTLHAVAPLNPDASDVSAILQYSEDLDEWTDGPPLAFPENGGLRAEARLTFTGVPRRLFSRVWFRLVP